MDDRTELQYEKCRALISVLTLDNLDNHDRTAIVSVLEDEFMMLGEAMRIVQS